MIEVSKISVQVAEKKLLHEVSLELNPGEVVALIGSNGAGKSTLLKAMAGALGVQQGTIFINDSPLSGYNSGALSRTRAVLSQSVQLSFSLSVLEVVQLGRYAYSQTESAATTLHIAHWALEQVGMQNFHHRNILTLSGGEQQRVHLARALAQLIEDPMPKTPKYLLLDEPVASLDIAQQHQVLALASQLAALPSLGVLVVLHDMNLASQYADRVLMMKNGRIVHSGAPAQIFTEANIRQVFEVSAIVGKHPLYDCPQVVAYG